MLSCGEVRNLMIMTIASLFSLFNHLALALSCVVYIPILYIVFDDMKPSIQYITSESNLCTSSPALLI